MLLGLILGCLIPSSSCAGQAHAESQRKAMARTYYNRGIERQAKGELSGAIADYDLAIYFDSECALAYHNRGVARFAKGDL
jgi:tetratricopeptide (TPR) repeat protein